MAVTTTTPTGVQSRERSRIDCLLFCCHSALTERPGEPRIRLRLKKLLAGTGTSLFANREAYLTTLRPWVCSGSLRT